MAASFTIGIRGGGGKEGTCPIAAGIGFMANFNTSVATQHLDQSAGKYYKIFLASVQNNGLLDAMIIPCSHQQEKQSHKHLSLGLVMTNDLTAAKQREHVR